jgi:diguanylate cyclase (GGDEF)-like protein/PAS domain S-box-containing protein
MGPWWIRAGGAGSVASPAAVSELADALTELAAGAERRPIVLMAADLHEAAAALEQLQQAAGQVLQISVLMPGGSVRGSEAELSSLQTALDNIPAPIFSKDAAGVYRACNHAFEEYLGLGRDEIIGATVYDVAPPDLARVYDAADRALLAEGGRQIYEAQVRYADGTIHDVTFFKAVYQNDAGEIEGLSGVMLDVTDHRRLEAELLQLAETDELTGLQNRRTFMSRASMEIERSASSETHPSFLLLDLDYFKSINDRWGHATGDEALCTVAACFQSALRSGDALARMGGEEFAVMLPGTSIHVAAQIAERIRQSVAELRIESKPQLRLTVSVGVSGWASAQTAEDVLQGADAALYEAKRTGRNRVVVASGAPTPADGAS